MAQVLIIQVAIPECLVMDVGFLVAQYMYLWRKSGSSIHTIPLLSEVIAFLID